MFKKTRKKFREIFSAPTVKDVDLDFPTYSDERTWLRPDAAMLSIIIPPRSEASKQREENRIIAKAELALQKDAMQKNLKVQHRTMMVALAAVVVAVLSSGIALYIALTTDPPTVNVEAGQPPVVDVDVQVPPPTVIAPGPNQ